MKISNKDTNAKYSKNEINKIISLYENGMSFTEIGLKLGRKKDNVRKILINNNVFVHGRDNIKKTFSIEEINEIIKLYSQDRQSTKKIAKIFNVSVTPIKRILKERNILRSGNSNGKKIHLTNEQHKMIKYLYVNEKLSAKEISEKINLSESFLNKYLHNSNYKRSKSESVSIGLKKRKITPQIRENMKRGQKKLVLSGKRKQYGGVCKKFNVNGIICHGLTEKKYIETLLLWGEELPNNCTYIMTPFGAYYPDFKNENEYIEIKSTYIYDVLLGKKKNRWSKKYDTIQYKKIKWVNDNILPVKIIIVNKNKFKYHKF